MLLELLTLHTESQVFPTRHIPLNTRDLARMYPPKDLKRAVVQACGRDQKLQARPGAVIICEMLCDHLEKLHR